MPDSPTEPGPPASCAGRSRCARLRPPPVICSRPTAAAAPSDQGD